MHAFGEQLCCAKPGIKSLAENNCGKIGLLALAAAPPVNRELLTARLRTQVSWTADARLVQLPPPR